MSFSRSSNSRCPQSHSRQSEPHGRCHQGRPSSYPHIFPEKEIPSITDQSSKFTVGRVRRNLQWSSDVYPSVELEVKCRAVHADTDWLLNHGTEESTICFFNIYVPIDGYNLVVLLLIIKFQLNIRRKRLKGLMVL